MKYFFLWEMVLYIGFMIGDLFPMPWSYATNYMKYMAVVSCVLYVWIRNKGIGDSVHFALLYSCCADYFMLFTEDIWIGIWGFFCVQICYGYEKCFLVAGVLFEVALILGMILEKISSFEVVVLMAFCYIVLSMWNLINVKKNMIWVAMVLLFIGDIFVGMNYFFPVVSPAMWFFYLPSQVCVVMSLY